MKHRYIESPFDKTVLQPWSFYYHPWSKEMLDCKDEHWCSQKGAQLSISEVLINITFYTLDKLRTSVLYGLPAERPDARDFCLTRFDPALKSSEHIRQMFNGVNSNTLKMCGTAALYIRGSRGAASFESIPVGAVHLDEVDKMARSAVALARERTSGHLNVRFREISTPSIPDRGINQIFKQSTQDVYTFKCPCCSKRTHLLFPECLEITAEDSKDPNVVNSFLKCKECGGKIEHLDKPKIFHESGEWVSQFSNRNIRGFHISQLYSCIKEPYKIASMYLDSALDPADEQVFYNSNLGLDHKVSGASVSDEQIEKCKKFYINKSVPDTKVVVMGIDVGNFLHFSIMQYRFEPVILDPNSCSEAKLLYFDKVKAGESGFPELHPFVKEYQPLHICIDAAPERTSSENFVKNYPYRAHTVSYIESIDGSSLIEPVPWKLHVNRTYWIDTFLGRFKNNTIQIPSNINHEYATHIKSMTKMYEKDRQGETIARYIKGGDRSDYAHTGVYCELALRKAWDVGHVANVRTRT